MIISWTEKVNICGGKVTSWSKIFKYTVTQSFCNIYFNSIDRFIEQSCLFGLWNSNYLVFQMGVTLVSSKIVEIFKMIFNYKEIAKEWRLKVLKEMERSLKRYISQATMMTKWNQNSLPCKITLIAIQLKTVTHAWVILSETFGTGTSLRLSNISILFAFSLLSIR